VGNYIGTVTYTNLASFPTVGRTNRLYIDGSTNLLYRWTGSAYVSVGGTSTVSGPASGDLTGTYPSPTIASGVVSLAKMANLTAYTIIGNGTGTSATPSALSGDQVTPMLNEFNGAKKGLVPVPSGPSTNVFLAADGSWQKIGTSGIANQPSDTLIGNDTGSSAPPKAVAIADLTTKLTAVVGDSGTGGTKGLVPAPASGDASNGKFLKADGTWTKPIISYVHTQNTSSTSWVIPHNLNFYPNVTVINSTGHTLVGDITYTSATSLTLTFSAAVSGTAYLS
jgi:hypothetical protein